MQSKLHAILNRSCDILAKYFLPVRMKDNPITHPQDPAASGTSHDWLSSLLYLQPLAFPSAYLQNNVCILRVMPLAVIRPLAKAYKSDLALVPAKKIAYDPNAQLQYQ